MKREMIITEDGSHTFYLPEIDENYHSTHGAIQESMHVFIDAGLSQVEHTHINVLELGFGTGLNALLALLWSGKKNINIDYFGIEKYPLNKSEYQVLNYCNLLSDDLQSEFTAMHENSWGNAHRISPLFKLTKLNDDFTQFDFGKLPLFDVVFFDAFAPNKQSEVWAKAIFQKIYQQCKPAAIFVTYCAKGSVRRDLLDTGFKVERIPGPPGKKEMLRAIK